MTLRPTPRQVDIGLNLLAAGVVASVAVALAGLTWRLAGATDGRTAVVAATNVVPVAAPVDLSAITRFAPFGTAAARPGGAGGASTLGLELHGVMLARPQSASTALIATAGGISKPYRMGDTLPGGAVLDTIEFDLVVLRVGGRLETLTFPVAPGGTATASRDATPPPTTAPPMTMGGGGHPPPPADPGDDHGPHGDPETLLGSLGAAPGPDGYKVGAGLSDDMRRAGLQPGDLIETINGQSIGDPVRDRALFDQAIASGRVSVEVVRDGKRIPVSLSLR